MKEICNYETVSTNFKMNLKPSMNKHVRSFVPSKTVFVLYIPNKKRKKICPNILLNRHSINLTLFTRFLK